MAIITFDSSLLTGWYQAKATMSTISAMRAQGLLTNTGATTKPPKATPPWDVDASPPSMDERLRAAMQGKDFIDFNHPFFSKDIPEDQKKLFGLYKALNLLQALAAHAGDEKTFSGSLNGLDRRFQGGLTEVFDYINKLAVESYTLSAGALDKRADSEVAIKRPLSEYIGTVAHTGTFDDPVGGLAGNEVFTMSIVKSGVTTNIEVDLSELGVQPANLDNIIALANQKLEDAGMLTTLSRERIFSQVKDEDGKLVDPSPLPNTFGIKIKGVSIEKLTFSAATSDPAVYISGTSGDDEHEGAQLLKLTDLASGTPVLDASARVVADGEETVSQGKATAIDSEGNVYMVGTTTGDLDNYLNLGEQDVFLTKYDSTGREVWKRMLGSAGTAEGYAVAVDSSDNVVIAGSVDNDLTSIARGGELDTFITKYDTTGAEIFTRQVGAIMDDEPLDLTIGADDSIYLSGYTKSSLASGLTYESGKDGFVTKLDEAGTLVYNRQFGTAGVDEAQAVAIDQNGDVVIASVEDGEAIVRKFADDGSSAAIWEKNLGTMDGGAFEGIALDGASIYLTGYTANTSLGGGSVVDAHTTFGQDGFIVKLTDSGASAATEFTTFIGTGSQDRLRDIVVSNGTIYVAGEIRGSVDGNPYVGTVNGLAAAFDSSGVRQWEYQYSGRDGEAVATSIVVDEQGSSVLDILGLPRGEIQYTESRTVTSQTTAREGDFFYMTIDGGAKRKITIEADDTMRSLAFKIDRLLVFDGDARSRRTSDGDKLRIEVNKGVRVELMSGTGGKDALAALGLKEGTLFDGGSLLDEDDGEDDGPPVFGLGLSSILKLTSRTDAAYALKILESALKEVRSVYREITKDPLLADLLKNGNKKGGPVPAYLTSQLANYQAGLSRLMGGGSVGGGFF